MDTSILEGSGFLPGVNPSSFDNDISVDGTTTVGSGSGGTLPGGGGTWADELGTRQVATPAGIDFSTSLSAVNADGTAAVGISVNLVPVEFVASLWTSDGNTGIVLGDLAGGNVFSLPLDINAAADLVTGICQVTDLIPVFCYFRDLSSTGFATGESILGSTPSVCTDLGNGWAVCDADAEALALGLISTSRTMFAGYVSDDSAFIAGTIGDPDYTGFVQATNLPEPGAAVQLGAGALTLALMQLRRRTSSRLSRR